MLNYLVKRKKVQQAEGFSWIGMLSDSQGLEPGARKFWRGQEIVDSFPALHLPLPPQDHSVFSSCYSTHRLCIAFSGTLHSSYCFACLSLYTSNYFTSNNSEEPGFLYLHGNEDVLGPFGSAHVHDYHRFVYEKTVVWDGRRTIRDQLYTIFL